jgi:hypothetical protein
VRWRERTPGGEANDLTVPTDPSNPFDQGLSTRTWSPMTLERAPSPARPNWVDAPDFSVKYAAPAERDPAFDLIAATWPAYGPRS